MAERFVQIKLNVWYLNLWKMQGNISYMEHMGGKFVYFVSFTGRSFNIPNG